jgi:hypothetical protein
MQASDLLDPRAVLGAVKAQPGNAGARRKPSVTAGLDRPCARRDRRLQAGTKERPLAHRRRGPPHPLNAAEWTCCAVPVTLLRPATPIWTSLVSDDARQASTA